MVPLMFPPVIKTSPFERRVEACQARQIESKWTEVNDWGVGEGDGLVSDGMPLMTNQPWVLEWVHELVEPMSSKNPPRIAKTRSIRSPYE